MQDWEHGHACVLDQPAHLGQSLADMQLLHEGMCEGCQTTVLWQVGAYDSNLAQRFLHDMLKVAEAVTLPLSAGCINSWIAW